MQRRHRNNEIHHTIQASKKSQQKNHSNIWTILCRVFSHLDSCANPLYTYGHLRMFLPEVCDSLKDSGSWQSWPTTASPALQFRFCPRSDCGPGHSSLDDCSCKAIFGSGTVEGRAETCQDLNVTPWCHHAKNTWFLHLRWKQEGFNAVFGDGSLNPKASWNMTERDGTHIDSHSKSLTSPYQFIARQQLGWFVVCLCLFLVFILYLSCSLASMKNRAILANSFQVQRIGRDGWWWWEIQKPRTRHWHGTSDPFSIYFSVPIHLPRLDIHRYSSFHVIPTFGYI
jgi:hypothetical protein